MNMHWITSSATAVTIAIFMSAAPAQAAMTPRIHTGSSMLQHVDCAVGFHIGPAGACVLGAEEEHHDVVIENAAPMRVVRPKPLRKPMAKATASPKPRVTATNSKQFAAPRDAERAGGSCRGTQNLRKGPGGADCRQPSHRC